MQQESGFLVNNKLDSAGILCSGLCAAHCILVPIIAYSSPAIASFFQNELIHLGLLALLTPIALIAFFNGLKQHGKSLPAIAGSIGVISLLLAVALESLEIEGLETILTTVGSALLITAHILNIKNLRA